MARGRGGASGDGEGGAGRCGTAAGDNIAGGRDEQRRRISVGGSVEGYIMSWGFGSAKRGEGGKKKKKLRLALFRLKIKIFWVSHRMCRKDVERGFYKLIKK